MECNSSKDEQGIVDEMRREPYRNIGKRESRDTCNSLEGDRADPRHKSSSTGRRTCPAASFEPCPAMSFERLPGCMLCPPARPSARPPARPSARLYTSVYKTPCEGEDEDMELSDQMPSSQM